MPLSFMEIGISRISQLKFGGEEDFVPNLIYIYFKQLTNGKRSSCNHRNMDVRWRLPSTKEV